MRLDRVHQGENIEQFLRIFGRREAEKTEVQGGCANLEKVWLNGVMDRYKKRDARG